MSVPPGTPSLKLKDLCFAQDYTGGWYESRVLDVITGDDPRAANITPEHIADKRGLKAKIKYHDQPLPVPVDSWVRIHFQGFNDRYDEWLLYAPGGPVCTSSNGKAPCFCVQHASSAPAEPRAAKKPVAASPTVPPVKKKVAAARRAEASVDDAREPGGEDADNALDAAAAAAAAEPGRPRRKAAQHASVVESDGASTGADDNAAANTVGDNATDDGGAEDVEDEAAATDNGKPARRRRGPVAEGSRRSGRGRAEPESAAGPSDLAALPIPQPRVYRKKAPAAPPPAPVAVAAVASGADGPPQPEAPPVKKKLGRPRKHPLPVPPPLPLAPAPAAAPVVPVPPPAAPVAPPPVPAAPPPAAAPPPPPTDDGDADVKRARVAAPSLVDASQGSAAGSQDMRAKRAALEEPAEQHDDKKLKPTLDAPTRSAADDKPAQDDDEHAETPLPADDETPGPLLTADDDDDDDFADDLDAFVEEEAQQLLQHELQQPTGAADSPAEQTATPGAAAAEEEGEEQGEPPVLDPHRIMDMDPSGVPKSVVPILAFCDAQNITREKLIRDYNLSDWSSALRYYLKGNNMARRSIILGGARLLQWWDAHQANRPVRSLYVDVEACIRIADPTQFNSKNRKRDLAIAAKGPSVVLLEPPKPPRLASEQPAAPQPKKSRSSTPHHRPHKASSHSVSRRAHASGLGLGLSVGGEGHWGSSNPGVRLLPATGKWEASVAPYAGFPAVRIGLFDSAEDAAESLRAATGALDALVSAKKQAHAGASQALWCSKCERAGATHELRACALCSRVAHIECLSAHEAQLSTAGEWLCSACSVELRNAAVTAAGGRAHAAPAPLGVRTRHASAPSMVPPKRKASARLQEQQLQQQHQLTHGGRDDAPKLTASEQLFHVPPAVDGDIEWLGAPFSSPPGRVNRCAHYARFRRQSTGEAFALLDHVLIARARDLEDEEAEDVYDFFVGQIEAMWQDLKTGERSVRVGWFFWPEEVLQQPPAGGTAGAVAPEHVGRGVELLSSSVADTEPAARVVARVDVLSWAAFQARDLDPAARMPEEPPAAAPAGEDARVDEHDEEGDNKEPPDTTLLSCARCGMWGFTNPPELSAHSQRYCGEDTPELLQARRATSGRAVLTDNLAPRPATRAVDPVRLARKGVDPKLDAMLSRAKARAGFGPLFVRHHYHQRSNKVRELAGSSKGSDDGRNAWQISILYSSLAQPELAADYASAAARKPDGAAASLPEPEPRAASRCGFCHKRLGLSEAFISCATCAGLDICVGCARLGRQGAWVGAPAGGCHRISHSYRVAKPRLSLLRPGPEAVAELDRLFARAGVDGAEYQLIEIARDNAESAPRAPTFRVGVKCASLAGGLAADDVAATVEDAKALAAATALCAYFGVGHSRTMCLLSRQWTQWEVARLVDGMQAHSLAWEHVAKVVGTKDAIECRHFFAAYVLPALEQQHIVAAKDESAKALLRDDLEALAVSASQVAVDEALRWAKRVETWKARQTPFAVLGDASVRLPTTFTPEPGAVCATCGQSGSDLMCDGCGRMFHKACVRYTAEWVCERCLDDEKYVYEHYSWGPAGAALCRLAAVMGGTDALPAWTVNDQLVEKAASSALEAALVNGTHLDQHQQALISSRDSVDKHLAQLKRLREAETRRHEFDLMGVPIDAAMETLIQSGSMPSTEEWRRKEWASRHYAEHIVAALETANRGLGAALVQALAERDAAVRARDEARARADAIEARHVAPARHVEAADALPVVSDVVVVAPDASPGGNAEARTEV